jgi:uncharacterized protein YlxW (UPF0749 family)
MQAERHARLRLAGSLTVVTVILGFMLGLQYRLTAGTRVPEPMASDEEAQRLQDQYNALQTQGQQLQKELAQLNAQLSAYEKQTAGSDSRLRAIQQKLEQERILAGITPVTGPGVTVTLMDGLATGSNTMDVLTHDWDVRSVINELFTAGAEAVAINNVRVVATTGVFCIGPVVKVNDDRLAPPYVIQAIGDPKTLKATLDMQGGVLDALRARGVRVSEPQIVQTLTLPAFTGTVSAGDQTG